MQRQQLFAFDPMYGSATTISSEPLVDPAISRGKGRTTND